MYIWNVIAELLPKRRRFSAPLGAEMHCRKWIDSSLAPILKDRGCIELPVQKAGYARYLFVAATLLIQPLLASVASEPKTAMDYPVRDYTHLLGIEGFQDALLKMHFQLYSGYVQQTNFLTKRLRELEQQGQERSYEYGALKRRFGWEYDGMRLHELYFGNLGQGKMVDKASLMYQKILKDFGSFDAWKKSFIATGLIRGIGWVILYYDKQSDRLFNTWINEHDLGHLAGGTPLLVMDVFEHAYITQFGLDRSGYINVFFENILWDAVERRFQNF